MVFQPPESLDELHRLFIRISKGKDEIKLNRRNLMLLKSMLDEPDITATKTISEIARENRVNISSITRLAQKLGFDGFSGLRDLLKNSFKQRKGFYSEQVKKFLDKKSDNTKDLSVLEDVIKDEWSNVMLTVESFDEDRFDKIINLLIQARHILVIGLRSSYSLAHYLGFYLKMVRDDVTIFGQAGHTLAEELSILRHDDVLVAISVTPYTKETVKACRLCRHHGIDIVALTDLMTSPLAAETENYLLTSILGDYFFSPMAAPMICIETLLSGVLKRLGHKAISRLHHSEEIFKRLGTEISAGKP